jgi:Ca2+-binding EF-hand superfamily protein
LNKRRARLVNLAFDVMDKDGSGTIEIADLADAYDTSKHPDVISGKKTKEQVLLEFLDTFTTGDNDDHKISREEFAQYYCTISASIDRDDYFELMIRNAWHISGGEGVCENSANRRVFVTLSDGSQQVVEIKNDLGLNMKDTKEILKRLRAQGVDAIQVSVNDSSESVEAPKNAKGKPTLSNRTGKQAPTTTVNKEKEADKKNPTNIPPAGVKLLIDKVKKALKLRGVNSFFDLQKRFKIMDDDNSGSISFSEFKKAVKEIQALQDLTDGDIRIMFNYFDKDGSNSVDFNEFISGVRDPMNEKRLFYVKKVFQKFDSDNNGFIEINDVINVYDTSKHPEVIAKRKTKSQVLTEFLQNFEVDGAIDGKVTYDEFVNYYNNISASIDNDNYFELMICNAWHINPVDDEGKVDPNKRNTTNLRLMVTNSQGREDVVILENDLGINNSNKDDLKLLYSRLKQQGVTDIMAINGKIIKVVNINGVDIVTSTGSVSTLKDDTNDKFNPNAPKVVKAPPFRPQTSNSAANAAMANAMNSRPRPVAGMSEPSPRPTTANRMNSNLAGNSSQKISTDQRSLANNILSNLNKRKAVNNKIQEENIIGSTLLNVLKAQLVNKGVAGIVDLQRKFNEFDANQNGIIDMDEFKIIFKTLNLIFSEDQVESLFHYFGEFLFFPLYASCDESC